MSTCLNKSYFCFSLLAFQVILFSGFSCTGSSGTNEQPEITITAIDCPADSVQITATAKRNNATNNWVVNLSVNVKCNGRNISNAEIKVNYLYTDYKITTNSTGDASRRFGPATADPKGGTIKVTVKGAGDNEVKKDVTITTN